MLFLQQKNNNIFNNSWLVKKNILLAELLEIRSRKSMNISAFTLSILIVFSSFNRLLNKVWWKHNFIIKNFIFFVFFLIFLRFFFKFLNGFEEVLEPEVIFEEFPFFYTAHFFNSQFKKLLVKQNLIQYFFWTLKKTFQVSQKKFRF